MKQKCFSLIAVSIFSLASGLPAANPADPPEVLKVEPPNWWTAHSINPVRLLVRGKGLSGARVSSLHHGVSVGSIRVNAAGSYLFVDVLIDAEDAVAGDCPLLLATAGGKAEVPFRLLKPLPAAGRFQGLSVDDVIYLLMPDRFANGDLSNDDPSSSPGLYDRQRARYYHGGDLQGVIDRLDYIRGLGVTAVWMNPVYDNVDHLNRQETYDDGPIADYHGYGAVDFYAVDEHLGDIDLLRQLVDKAHARGIKVIQDQVANHSGPYHPWVEDPPTPTWYHGTAAEHLANTWQTWTLADPYASPQTRRETLDGWFIDILPDLNQDDEEAARYIIQNSLWWIGVTGFDAVRQDTLPYVPRYFWRDWMKALKEEFPRLDVVGEFFERDPALVSFFQGGRARHDGIDSGIDALFDFPLYDALTASFAQGRSFRDLAKVFAHDHLYVDPSMLVTFVDLHDTKRFMSRPGGDAAGLKMAYTLIFTARGIPLIYYGSEIGMAGGDDPDNRRDFPGGWPDDARNAFRVQGRTSAEQEIHDHVVKLAALRRSTALLRRGRMMHLHVSDDAYAYARVGEGSAALALFNKSEQPLELTFGVDSLGFEDGELLIDRLGGGAGVLVKNGRLSVDLAARSTALMLPSSESGPSQ